MGKSDSSAQVSERTALADVLMEFMGAYGAAMHQAADEVGLTMPQSMLLQHLDSETGMPMSEIARSLRCDTSNATGLVDRLESRGLVARRSAPADRRVREVVLTPEGRVARDRLARLSRDDNPLLRHLDGPTCRRLTTDLRHLLDKHAASGR